MDSTRQPVTQLLAQWRAGDEQALAQLSTVLYDELRRLAQQHLRRERRDHTIQRTALVNEAFMRLIGQQSVDWQSRAHFFGLASRLMRRILVDYARARSADKRGGGVDVFSLDALADGKADEATPQGVLAPAVLPSLRAETHEDVTAIDAALTRLAHLDPEQAKLVELRYFGGLTIEQTAEALDVSPATVKREWTLARAWLRRELAGG